MSKEVNLYCRSSKPKYEHWHRCWRLLRILIEELDCIYPAIVWASWQLQLAKYLLQPQTGSTTGVDMYILHIKMVLIALISWIGSVELWPRSVKPERTWRLKACVACSYNAYMMPPSKRKTPYASGSEEPYACQIYLVQCRKHTHAFPTTKAALLICLSRKTSALALFPTCRKVLFNLNARTGCCASSLPDVAFVANNANTKCKFCVQNAVSVSLAKRKKVEI